MISNQSIEEKLVFILSSPRSGSTLFRLSTARCSEIIALPETHFFSFIDEHSKLTPSNKIEREIIIDAWLSYHTIQKWPSNKVELRAQLLQEFTTWKDLLLISIKAYCTFNEVNLATSKAIVEKSPPHIFYTESIKNMFPGSHAIGLVRDPRDVVASLKTRSWSTSNPYTNTKAWVLGLKRLESNGLSVIRYEDFVVAPDKCIRNEFQKLGIDIDTNLSQGLDNSDLGLAGNFNALEKVDSKYVGKWKQQLSIVDGEQYIIERYAKAYMDIYMYKDARLKNTNFKLKMKYLLMRLNHNISRLV